MAIYYDNFQSYSVGATTPWGSLFEQGGGTVASISNGAGPDGVVGPYGQSQFLTIPGANIIYNDATYRSSGTVAMALQYNPTNVSGILGEIVRFNNGTTGGSVVRIFAIVANYDGTLSPIDWQGNCIGPLSTDIFRPYEWKYIQINVSFSNVGGQVAVTYAVYLDGTEVMSGSVTTTFNVSGLPNPSGFWDESVILASNATFKVSNFCLDVLQPPNTFQVPGSPVNRSTQQVIELIQYPSTSPPPPPGTVTVPCPLGTASLSHFYDSFANAIGGTGPYTYSLNSGAFPPGITLDTSTGEVSGTPTSIGTFLFQIKAVDSLGAVGLSSGCQIIVYSVFPPPPPPVPPARFCVAQA